MQAPLDAGGEARTGPPAEPLGGADPGHAGRGRRVPRTWRELSLLSKPRPSVGPQETDAAPVTLLQ